MNLLIAVLVVACTGSSPWLYLLIVCVWMCSTSFCVTKALIFAAAGSKAEKEHAALSQKLDVIMAIIQRMVAGR